jgi:hypothetical protein
MPIIFCDISLFTYEQPIYILDNEKIMTEYRVDIEQVPEAICALAYKTNITNIKLRGQAIYTEPWINEIKTTYSLNYGKNDLEIEVI